MGHSEMLLAVAGLKPAEIKERTGKLATGDWSAFSPAERVAFQFAYKLSREPAAVSNDDVAALTEMFGRHRALDLIWYIGWCNYMTRVADAFQLPLEKENVFDRPPEKIDPQEVPTASPR
jgi:alkylhydroperoxidase family enzyme